MGSRRLARTTTVAAAIAALALTATACTASTSPTGGGMSTVKMVLWPGPEGDAMQKVVNAYNAGQGKTDHVQVQMVLLSRTDTFSKEATQMATKSSNFDVYFTASYVVAQHAPYLEPLSGIDTSKYFPVAAKSLQVNGRQMALPLDVSNHFLYYRTDLIGRLLSDPTWKAQYGQISARVLGKTLAPKDPKDWNWEDFLAAAAFFTQKYNPQSPTRYGSALQLKDLLYNVMIWDDVLWSFGGSWLSPSGTPDLTSKAATQAVNVYRTAYTKGLTSPDSAQAEFPETQAAMTSGNAAFTVQWSAGFNDLNNPAKSPKTAGKIGIAPVPGPRHQTHVHALAVGLNKYSKNKAAARKWLSYLATTAAMTKYAQAGGIPGMPSVLAALQSEHPIFKDISTSLSQYAFSEPALPNTFQIYSKLADDLSPAWVGAEPVSQALQKANGDLTTLMK